MHDSFSTPPHKLCISTMSFSLFGDHIQLEYILLCNICNILIDLTQKIRVDFAMKVNIVVFSSTEVSFQDFYLYSGFKG